MKKSTIFQRLLIIAFALVMCVAFAACSSDGGSGEDGDDSHYAVEDMEVGSELGSFTSTDLDGNEVTEAIFAEKDITIINVWGTFCGPCIDEMPDLAKWDKKLPDNVQIIGIVIDVPEGDKDMIATAKDICKDTKVKYTNIVTSDSVDKMMSSVEAIPTTFILDGSGKTIFKPFVGADVDGYKQVVKDYLDQL